MPLSASFLWLVCRSTRLRNETLVPVLGFQVLGSRPNPFVCVCRLLARLRNETLVPVTFTYLHPEPADPEEVCHILYKDACANVYVYNMHIYYLLKQQIVYVQYAYIQYMLYIYNILCIY